jgi:hypothetical protein
VRARFNGGILEAPPLRAAVVNCEEVGAVHPNPPGRLRLIAPAWGIWDEQVTPFIFTRDQSSADRVLTNVGKLLSQTFIVAKAMIEEIPLPFNARYLGGNPFVIAN